MKRKWAESIYFLIGVVVVPIALCLTAGRVTTAATLTVNSLGSDGDGVCDLMECTLREAIDTAAADDTIVFGVDGSILGNYHINKNLTIIGNGVEETIISANGYTAFHITGEAVVAMENLTVTGGSAIGAGGIINFATLTLTNCRISENDGGDGGGILNTGRMTINNCTVSDNVADMGHGIFNNNGTMQIHNSTIANNSTTYPNRQGGGIHNRGASGQLTIVNSTVSGNNDLSGYGGGIFNDVDSTATVIHTTISGNIADHGSGLYNLGTMTVKNSIVAANTGGENCYNTGTFLPLGENLDTDGSCTGFTHSAVTTGALHLGPLIQEPGVATATHSLQRGSVAIDAVSDCTDVSADQRGVSRPLDGDGDGAARCDLGAYEASEVDLTALEQIENILDHIDASVADGSLIGTGPGASGANRIKALKNMIASAGEMISVGDTTGACAVLGDTLGKTDGFAPPVSPPDFVEGPAAPVLADMIRQLMADLDCV